jgi:hypothetical protein
MNAERSAKALQILTSVCGQLSGFSVKEAHADEYRNQMLADLTVPGTIDNLERIQAMFKVAFEPTEFYIATFVITTAPVCQLRIIIGFPKPTPAPVAAPQTQTIIERVVTSPPQYIVKSRGAVSSCCCGCWCLAKWTVVLSFIIIIVSSIIGGVVQTMSEKVELHKH